MTTMLSDAEFDELCEQTWDTGQLIREAHRAMARTPPLVRLWANPTDPAQGLLLRGIAADSNAGNFPFKKNRAGTGTLKLRGDHFLARWLMTIPNNPAAKKNVVISVDHMGGRIRWSGLLKHWRFTKDKDGIRFLEATFVDDLQFLSYLLAPPNPALPLGLFQFPRVFTLLGPTIWAASMTIWLNLWRFQGNWWNLPDDPFDFSQWTDAHNMNTWQVIIKAPTFFNDPSLPTLLAARMDPIDKVIEDAIDDAQVVIRYRRIFTVDGEVSGVPGVDNPRNGVLELSLHDRSGYYEDTGTGTTGTVLDGFKRSIAQFASGFMETVDVFVSDDQTLTPPEYYLKKWFGVVPSHPWIVLRDSEWSNIEASDLSWGPAGPVQIVVGGQNEFADSAIELAIQAAGNMIGYFFLGGFSSAGDMAATVIMPLLRGTVLAWNNFKSGARAINLGWVHLMEMYQSGANNAWTISAVMAIRTGMLATADESASKMRMSAGAPYYPGLHMLTGDRVAHSIEGMTDSITTDPLFVNQIEEMNLAWDAEQDAPHDYEITAGTGKALMTQAERSSRLMSKAMATLQNIGVSLV